MLSSEGGSRSRNLIERGIVWDNHGCMPLRADETTLAELERYRAAGVDVVSLNVGFADQSWEDHVHILKFMRGWVAAHPGSYRLVSRIEDVRQCKAEGKLGVVFDVEGMCPVQNEPERVQLLYELGVRWMLVAYNRNNAAGGGCLDEDRGLTRTGREIINIMSRVGMILCLSHTGARTAAEAIEYSPNPVIFSHSNPYGDYAHSRNISDSLMLACAGKGDVIGLSGFGPFLGVTEGLVDRLVRQILYVVDLVGPAHVGLGLDYVFDQSGFAQNLKNHPERYPVGLDGFQMIRPEDLTEIVEKLTLRLNDEAIHGILGENWQRIAGQVWK